MALGGGTFSSQNKVLPGAYFQFISTKGARNVAGERGVAAIALELDWGEDNVDIIFLLALNFDNINTTKMFFADLSRFLNSESKIQRIRKSNNEMEIEKSIMSDLHWS